MNPGASQSAIAHHYDVGNDFWALWLDPTMTYSCGLWDSASDLEAAQLAKIDYLASQSRARGAAHLLDVGCGWGGALRRMTTAHQVGHAVGLTLSTEQAAYIRGRGWPDVSVNVTSWSDHATDVPYDAIVSAGAFEHFARLGVGIEKKLQGYRSFFRRCHEWLKPGGYLALQTVSYENSRSEDFSEFFATQIFPESDLPRLSEIAAASEMLFEIVALRNDREQYERTMSEWRKRLRANRTQAVALVGEELVARTEKFLQLFMIGFHTGTMGLLRLTLRRIDRPRIAISDRDPRGF
jgi:cyclopropane-fatty-acyl-phospholipid synthase